MAKRTVHSDKYKAKACKYVTHDGMSINKAAKKAKVSFGTLSKWIDESKGGSPAAIKPSTLSSELDAKIQELQDEIAILEKARDILR